MSIWDDPELQISDDYVKFENPGDTITGTITAIRIHRFDDKAVPQVIVRTPDGRDRTITGGQARLKALLAEKRPEVGDTITVTMTNIEKRAGGKTLKHFELEVGNTGTAPTASVAAPADDVKSKLAGMSPEEVEAIKLLLQ